jgi:hypothetical protein
LTHVTFNGRGSISFSRERTLAIPRRRNARLSPAQRRLDVPTRRPSSSPRYPAGPQTRKVAEPEGLCVQRQLTCKQTKSADAARAIRRSLVECTATSGDLVEISGFGAHTNDGRLQTTATVDLHRASITTESATRRTVSRRPCAATGCTIPNGFRPTTTRKLSAPIEKNTTAPRAKSNG